MSIIICNLTLFALGVRVSDKIKIGCKIRSLSHHFLGFEILQKHKTLKFAVLPYFRETRNFLSLKLLPSRSLFFYYFNQNQLSFPNKHRFIPRNQRTARNQVGMNIVQLQMKRILVQIEFLQNNRV